MIWKKSNFYQLPFKRAKPFMFSFNLSMFEFSLIYNCPDDCPLFSQFPPRCLKLKPGKPRQLRGIQCHYHYWCFNFVLKTWKRLHFQFIFYKKNSTFFFCFAQATTAPCLKASVGCHVIFFQKFFYAQVSLIRIYFFSMVSFNLPVCRIETFICISRRLRNLS